MLDIVFGRVHFQAVLYHQENQEYLPVSQVKTGNSERTSRPRRRRFIFRIQIKRERTHKEKMCVSRSLGLRFSAASLSQGDFQLLHALVRLL